MKSFSKFLENNENDDSNMEKFSDRRLGSTLKQAQKDVHSARSDTARKIASRRAVLARRVQVDRSKSS